MKRCIWCKTLNVGESKEHIIPEALGCPSEFVFTDGTVCIKCNNGLGHLDQIVCEQFDFLTFEHGVKRKKNKRPSIKSRGNVIADYDNNGRKYYIFNMENSSVTSPYGEIVAPYKGSERNVKASFEVNNGIAKVSFDIKITNRKKFRRGLAKIALSSLAYFVGNEIVLNQKFDSIRTFVIKGKGEIPIIYSFNSDKLYKHNVSPPYTDEFNNYLIKFRIACIEFLVDLSQEHSLFYKLKENINNQTNQLVTGIIPINA